MRVFIFLLLFVFIPPAFAAEQAYICPMHPHISGQDGDSCPICGMSLVPKIEENIKTQGGGIHTSEMPEGAFKIDPSFVHVLGVKTDEVTHHTFGKTVRAYGEISSSTRLEYKVDVRAKGWIVNLAKDAVGDVVKKGDLLFTYYSPELMEAQSDFLIGRNVGGGDQRLRLYGMGAKAIKELRQKGKFLEETPFYAFSDGTVTMLSVRKGAHVQEGGNVMTIQDFSKVWVNVDVPLRDAQFLSLGTKATVLVPETGEEYETIIDFIHPVNDPKTRTVMVRLILDNPDGTLKPETYVDAVFEANPASRLAVPLEAVLYSSAGAYVMENVKDGYFRPVMVEIGITSNGLTEIKSGLSHGQRIVTSGQFMLDAETNLRGGMAAMGHDHGGIATENAAPEMKGMDHGQH
ncbi:MAG: efflux RND transporter periplasmic adaptor subunit [Alphaproteobacteria bacterium]